jgi:hypothetical protein
MHNMAQAKGLSPEYTAYRDRVVTANASIGDADTVQKALDLLGQTPSIVQWLDARHGVGRKWFSICGPQADASPTVFGNPALGNDMTLGGQRTLAGGNWDGGTTPELGPGDSYSWGMRYIQPGPDPSDGFFWGNRYGNTAHPSLNVWNFLAFNQLQSYYEGNTSIPLALPIGSWEWVWAVKDGPEVTVYDTGGLVLGRVACPAIGELPIGIAGGSDSAAVASGSKFRYQTFIRANGALTAAQRAAIQAI